MNIVNTDDGYKMILYKADEFGRIIEPIVTCVMCHRVAFFIAEQNEALCKECKERNDEARGKKA